MNNTIDLSRIKMDHWKYLINEGVRLAIVDGIDPTDELLDMILLSKREVK